MARIGILGAGSWGTALAILLHDNGHDVTVWSIHEEEVETLQKDCNEICLILNSILKKCYPQR